MSILQKLTEGVVRRDVSREGQALLEKWEQTGLLEGLDSERNRQGMAVLLENQAKELLREASQMSAGDVEGFAAVAFPIVRRVFGGLIANDLVSVQPMSLPSGLIFFLDFQQVGRADQPNLNESVYGGNVVAAELTGGVDLSPNIADDPGGFYNFNTGRSHATGSALVTITAVTNSTIAGTDTIATVLAANAQGKALKKLVRFDPDLLDLPTTTRVLVLDLTKADMLGLNEDALAGIALKDEAVTSDTSEGPGADALTANIKIVRRLTHISPDDSDKVRVVLVCAAAAVDQGGVALASTDKITFSYPVADKFTQGGNQGLGNVVGSTSSQGWELESAPDMAEIDIKVDSIAVTAMTKKLKAKWTPELAQDLNAYHNLDAEVELTGILSEQIALEIDREILGDLVAGAKAGTRYWSRAPGLFVDSSGAEIGASSAAPDFTGTVSEWYETLIETINDVSAQIHRKTLRGGANFCVCSPEVASILEMTAGFRANVTVDSDRGDIGAVKTGSLTKKFDLYVDPYFPRNIILVGRKGASFLESGYVYAPYVPLQVTPTIFGTEDFVPRKGVMTRYGKKMVRPDMYGVVIVRGLLGEAGATA